MLGGVRFIRQPPCPRGWGNLDQTSTARSPAFPPGFSISTPLPARAARSGRRSYDAGKSDVMSPGCLLDGIRPGWEADLHLTRERHLCHAAPGIRPGFGEPG